MSHPITKAIEVVGLGKLAGVCGVTYQAIRKWERAGRLPRTEWTGETNYARKIAAAVTEAGTPMSRDDLLVVAPAPERAAA